MTYSRSCVQAMLGACLIAWSVVAQSQAALQHDTVLVHRFSIPGGESWGSISIDIVPGGWHVGDVEGRLATDVQLRHALRDLVGLEVGGRCTGWFDGLTAYPCGFSLRDVDLASAVSDRYAALAMDWEALSAARELADRGPLPGTHASAPSGSTRLDVQRFVALRMPLAYLGDKRAAFGGKLRFEIRAVSNALVPSLFDLGSGLVILQARLRGERS